MVSELEKDIIMDGVEAGVLKVQEVQPRWRSWALWRCRCCVDYHERIRVAGKVGY